jgi:hypothetical protein
LVQEVRWGKTALFSACWHRPARETMQYEPELQLHNKGKDTVEARTAVMLKANALEVIEEELERLEDRLEKLIQEVRRANEEIRSEIRKAKLMIIIGFTALIAFQILLRWLWF